MWFPCRIKRPLCFKNFRLHVSYCIKKSRNNRIKKNSFLTFAAALYFCLVGCPIPLNLRLLFSKNGLQKGNYSLHRSAWFWFRHLKNPWKKLKFLNKVRIYPLLLRVSSIFHSFPRLHVYFLTARSLFYLYLPTLIWGILEKTNSYTFLASAACVQHVGSGCHTYPKR